MSWDEFNEEADRLRTDDRNCVGPVNIRVALDMARACLGPDAPDEAVEGVFLEAMSSGQVHHRQSAKGRFHRDPLLWKSAELKRGDDDDHVRVVRRIPGSYVGNFAPSQEVTYLGVCVSGDGLAFWLKRHVAASMKHLLQVPEDRSTIDRATARALHESMPTVKSGERELSAIDKASGRRIGQNDESRQQIVLWQIGKLLWESGKQVSVRQSGTYRGLGNGKDAVIALARQHHKLLNRQRVDWRGRFDVAYGPVSRGPQTNEATGKLRKTAEDNLAKLDSGSLEEINLDRLLLALEAA